MSRYVEPTFVILGANLRDCQQEHRRLVTEEPERIFGHRVAALTPQSIHSFDGLLVHDHQITEQAPQHRGYSKAWESLRRAILKTPQNGDQCPTP